MLWINIDSQQGVSGCNAVCLHFKIVHLRVFWIQVYVKLFELHVDSFMYG